MVNEEALEREELDAKDEVFEVMEVFDVFDVMEAMEVFDVMEELALSWCGSIETVCNSIDVWGVGAGGGVSSAVSPGVSPSGVSPVVSPVVSPEVAGANFFWPVVALGVGALSCCRSS